MATRAKNNSFLNNISSIFIKLQDVDLPICVFKVPNSIASAKPEAYLPQLVGLGPYHHLRPELQQMQMCKLNEAKRVHEGFQCIEFEHLVELLDHLVGPSIRACYSTYLDMDDDVLVCVMAIDGLFLFELLCCYGVSKDELAKSDFLRDLVIDSGRAKSLAGDITSLGESMMLENQIPILVLKMLLVIECSHISTVPQNEEQIEASLIVKKLFPQMLLFYCKAVSPLKVLENYPQCKVFKHAHLLDLLYHLIVLKELPDLEPDEEEEEENLLEKISQKIISFRSEAAIEVPKKPLSIQPQNENNVILGRALKIAGDLILPQEVRKPVQLVSGLLGLPWTELWSRISTPTAAQGPHVEEISIPSASQLHKAGVKFCSKADDHITTVSFDSGTVSLHLPMIKLDVNSEVVIRNLVAYEGLVKAESEPLIFTRYVEIMSGIIETADDVKVLREKGILEFESLKDGAVVTLFNGMSKSARLTNAANLDKAIEEVNKYYNGLWKVSACKLIRKWRRNTWNFCRTFAVLVIFLLLVVYTFCMVYGCPRLFIQKSECSSKTSSVSSLRSYI